MEKIKEINIKQRTNLKVREKEKELARAGTEPTAAVP